MIVTPRAAYVHGITERLQKEHHQAPEHRLDDAFRIYVSKNGIADGYRKLEALRGMLKKMAMEAGKK
jgi:hypothetical protein